MQSVIRQRKAVIRDHSRSQHTNSSRHQSRDIQLLTLLPVTRVTGNLLDSCWICEPQHCAALCLEYEGI
ncbi:hypothetical protein PC116_g23335 [Phytophthora cactorum]|uniref:Uncharacterized protein n=1 Tax=Phytophthora cactorum TaxID=29920 RepID=A0A8T1K2I0_9STRA|nr:hypothetical protein Pcac1_g13201 [Phytophthora cactorum]KAG2907726.1 hypothetical protein PC117_g20146 [Phytophthora cactorum]KAG4228301.1 hypothetical protein PC116_g23335 [Phytophthora cactorum]